MNAQAAQAKAPKKAENKPKAPRQHDRQESGGMKQKMHDLPVAAGALIMAALLTVSLFVGNFRALQSATPKAFVRQGDVKSIIEDRLDAAHNVLTVAQRAKLDEMIMRDVRNAMEALEEAKTARDVSRADQALSAAVSELATAQLSQTDEQSMRKAADEFAEAGSMLRQEARAYDAKAKRAEELYDGLPTRFALPEPDRYEGLA